MIADACLREAAEGEIALDFAAFLRKHDIPDEDVRALLEGPPRITIYRRLVRNNLTGVTYRLLPRTRARMNAAVQGAFDESFARFLEAAPPKTHVLKDVPAEFLAWALPSWGARADLPGYLQDLARYELLHFDIGSMPKLGEPQDLAELALDRPLAFSSVARLLRTGTAVHLLSEDEDDLTAPAPGPCHLLLYRDDDHAVRVLELGDLAYAALARMMDGAPLGDALREASLETGHALGDELLAQVARLLADLGDRGVLKGARSG